MQQFSALRYLLIIALLFAITDSLFARKRSKHSKVKQEVHGATHSSFHIAPTPSTQSIIATLSEGIHHFVTNYTHVQDFVKERKELTNGQKPYAIVLACTDSSVSPELVFDEEFGHLFVVRVAGNIVDSTVLASIEYAAESLGAKTLIIMGHEKCGAVKAACEHATLTPNLNCLLRGIAPAVTKAESIVLDKKDLLHVAIQENVPLQMHNALLQSSLLTDLVEHHHLEVTGSVYDLETGLVNWLMPEQEKTAEMTKH